MRILVAGLVVSAGSLLVFAQEPTRITSASNVRLRASPSESAAVVASLALGTDLIQLDTGGDGATWTRVRTAGGHDGWLPSRLTRSLTSSRRIEVIEAIVRERLERKGDAFAPRSELSELVERTLKDAQDPEAAGRFALYWITSMAGALQAVPSRRGKEQPHKDWLAARADAVVYHELGQRWVIRQTRLWQLHDAHARTASADELAWAAVINGSRGECEGFVPCYVRWLDLLEGEYLRRSALGQHVGEAVARVANAASAWGAPVPGPYFLDPAKDCVELVQSLDPLRAALATTRADGLQSVLANLDKLRSGCKG
ncbi:MAG TPA: SH3 domain-containing protein [Vicinamibacterales bacterium]|nr:SH3 domain-containing protein [Vicinamibacterales bacterium]